MTPPTPAAVRAAMKPSSDDCTDEEEDAFVKDARYSEDILKDHIRAIAAEMRADADRYDQYGIGAPYELRKFADKLEGKQ